jgi:hypothetical protein
MAAPGFGPFGGLVCRPTRAPRGSGSDEEDSGGAHTGGGSFDRLRGALSGDPRDRDPKERLNQGL